MLPKCLILSKPSNHHSSFFPVCLLSLHQLLPTPSMPPSDLPSPAKPKQNKKGKAEGEKQILVAVKTRTESLQLHRDSSALIENICLVRRGARMQTHPKGHADLFCLG
uniref:Uncharacterized protein n=1 Tax=Phasianus colchicus TaxID=9054 RepID=A0A669Q3H5_PHACC